MKKYGEFIKTIFSSLLCGIVFIGLVACTSSGASKKFEMFGVEFTGDLTQEELKNKIAGRDPDVDTKEKITYEDIDGFEGIDGDLSVYFRTDGTFSDLYYELSDKSQYSDLKTELIAKYGEPQHSENVNDMRRTAYNYWRISDDTSIKMYRGSGYGGQWYNTYIQVYNLNEKAQENINNRTEKYKTLQKNLKNEDYNKAFKQYLDILDLDEKPLNEEVIKQYNFEYKEDKYDSSPISYDFIGTAGSFLGNECTLRIFTRNPNSKYGSDDENGMIKGVSLYLEDNEITKEDEDFLNEFVPIFGDWEWNDDSEKAVYDNGLFETEISKYGSINSSLLDYYVVDTQYINVSSNDDKYEAYEAVDVMPYVTQKPSNVTNKSLFDSSGRTSSHQATDIITAIENMSNQNQFGWSIVNLTEFDNDNYHCTNFDVYINGQDTNQDLVVRADKNTGKFKGLSYYSTEKDKAPIIETEDLAMSYQAIILYTDSTIDYADASEIYDGALDGGITKNGRIYKISIEDGYLMLNISTMN